MIYKTKINNLMNDILKVLNKISKELAISAIDKDKSLQIIFTNLENILQLKNIIYFQAENNTIKPIGSVLDISNCIISIPFHNREDVVELKKGIYVIDKSITIFKIINVEYNKIILSSVILNNELLGFLAFYTTKENIDPLELELIENVSYKWGGIIGTQESFHTIVEKQKNFEHILNNFHDIIIIASKNENVIFHNKALGELLGITEEEISEIKLSDIFFEETKFELYNAIEKIFSGSPYEFCYAPLKSFTNEVIPVESFITKIIWHNEEKLFLVIRDLKKYKDIEEKLNSIKEQYESIRSLFFKTINGLIFSLRTPIYSILGILDLLKNSSLNAIQKNYLNVLKNASEQALHYVEQLFNVTFFEQGKVTIQKNPFSLKKLLAKVLNLFLLKSTLKGIQIICEYVDIGQEYYLRGDNNKLFLILQNIIEYSLRHTKTGKIIINVAVDNSYKLIIEIHDSGDVMSVDKVSELMRCCKYLIPHIDPVTNQLEFELTIAYNFAKYMGGEFYFEGINGYGNKYTLILPFEESNFNEVEIFENKDLYEIHTDNLDNINVLIVEDDVFNQYILKEYLIKLNANVDTAIDGKSALELLKNNIYNLVIVDILLPDMNGKEILNFIKNNLTPPYNRIPVIAITATTEINEHNNLINSGFNDTITKPAPFSLIYSKIIKQIGFSKKIFDEKIKESFNNIIFKEVTEEFYDLEHFKISLNNDIKAVINLIEIFIEQTLTNLENLDKAQKENNLAEIDFITHKMRPSISLLGIKKAEELVSLINNYAKNNAEINLIASHISKLRQLLVFVIELLKEDVKKLKKQLNNG